MILIVGGMGAGKRAFAMETLGAKQEDMTQSMDSGSVLYDLQDLRPLPSIEELMAKKIVICNEVGSGIVPMEREERAHREAVGRLCTCLAQQAQAVYRVCCGLGMRLK